MTALRSFAELLLFGSAEAGTAPTSNTAHTTGAPPIGRDRFILTPSHRAPPEPAARSLVPADPCVKVRTRELNSNVRADQPGPARAESPNHLRRQSRSHTLPTRGWCPPCGEGSPRCPCR